MLKNNWRRQKQQHEKLPSMQRVQKCMATQVRFCVLLFLQVSLAIVS